MDIDALLEAFQDFEKKGKKESCPALEQFLRHVAKTGQPVIPWSQFKLYFLYKLEKVMDDFHASMPEQRGLRNPNVEFVPFDEMKKRILKIVDGYNGIPFTIQRLCELLVDPKQNYSGSDKFLRGLEKNVMVVSCTYPASDQNVNGPGTPKTLNRTKLLLSTSLSTNGLPDCPVSKEPDPTADVEEHRESEVPLSEDEMKPKGGIKNRHEEERCDGDEQDTKRLKLAENEEDESKGKESESSCHEEPGSSLQSQESSEASGSSPSDTDRPEQSHTRTEAAERDEGSTQSRTAPNIHGVSPVDPSEQSAPSETDTSLEQDSEECNSSSCDRDEQVSSSSSSPDVSEGGADISDLENTTNEAQHTN
ncbi:serine/threonine-protein phosphatase 4 regulatory subunit 2-A isoform X2 [Nothobranchius furzeri]|uniref:Transcript variant X2 n=1 Tax=Nothobranchius furzeri TaxID=105023 RepID=A0A9D3BIF1_NOTFU|nr:serine/threonine-protein phosphatase 4 regulatory subunit 2-A isoform X2 [Nothobranchius furzeri]KAF7209291.1 transcript variant X2 [Nothobranchius furzeri]